MDLKGSRTEGNLRKAFDQELRAYFEYLYAAKSASDEGFELVADVFHQTAQNEAEHAQHEFHFLGGSGGVKTNLQAAIRHEDEATAFYRKCTAQATEEGFEEIANFFQRIGKVEETHKTKFEEILEGFEGDKQPEGRTVRHSALTMAQLMLPAQANPAGFVHGGELMKLMDNAAGVTAARHSDTNVVTALVSEINFLHPVLVGSLVTVYTRITFVSRSSMEIQVELQTENLMESEKRIKALTAYYTMVSVNNLGQPQPIPPLILYTEEEQRLFDEGMARYQERKAKRA
jgi:acyl-CoA hydrolase/ferritin